MSSFQHFIHVRRRAEGWVITVRRDGDGAETLLCDSRDEVSRQRYRLIATGVPVIAEWAEQ